MEFIKNMLGFKSEKGENIYGKNFSSNTLYIK